MGCGQSTPAVEEANSSARSPKRAKSPGRSTKSTNGTATSRNLLSGNQERKRESKKGSGMLRQQRSNNNNQFEPEKSMERKAVLDAMALMQQELVVKDPERLGLSSDFNEQAAEHSPPKEFTFEELEDITKGFDDRYIIGEGGFGSVYRGKIQNDDGESQYVAIKKLNQEGMQGFNEWLTEVIFLRRLRHPHLVRFVGYCTEEEQGVLVYEFMQNGSLDYHLFGEGDNECLTWEQRVNVALGAAKGLAYLHEGTGRQVIFRDLKAANILLDKDYNAKLSDFGLAKDGPSGDRTHVSTKVVGTFGYTAPEYMQTGHLTAKSDVYAFGVVLLELLSGRRAVDETKPWEQRNLAFWAKPFLADKRKLPQFIDPRLGSEYHAKAAQKLAVAASCCLLDVKSRPSMVHLVQILTAIREMSEKTEPYPRELSDQPQKEVEEHKPWEKIGEEEDDEEEEEDEETENAKCGGPSRS